MQASLRIVLAGPQPFPPEKTRQKRSLEIGCKTKACVPEAVWKQEEQLEKGWRLWASARPEKVKVWPSWPRRSNQSLPNYDVALHTEPLDLEL
jgi:hypothetical protein